jgi:hypothetical protein
MMLVQLDRAWRVLRERLEAWTEALEEWANSYKYLGERASLWRKECQESVHLYFCDSHDCRWK